MKRFNGLVGLTTLLYVGCAEEETHAEVTIDRETLLARANALREPRRGPSWHEYVTRERNCDFNGVKPAELEDALSTLYTDAGRAYVVREVLDQLRFEAWVERTGGLRSDGEI